jgi:DNA-binding CsgD family transcriptional regulator
MVAMSGMRRPDRRRSAPTQGLPARRHPTIDMNHLPRIGLHLGHGMVEALARTMRSVGHPEFFESVFDLLGTACAVDIGGVMFFFRHRQPQRVLHRFDPTARNVPEERYLDGPYVLDPSYQSFLRGAGTGVYWLRDVAPDDFFESEYHRVFYSQTGVSDSVDLMWRIDDDVALLYFLERGGRSPGFEAADIAALQLMLPYVVAASARHHQLTKRSKAPDVDALMHRKVQSTIDNFGRSLLTKREREVLFYMLSGYSSALTSERLNTAEGTIKIHRKNIHRKLDVGSQAELFSLFIKCIPFAAPESADGADPLEAYQSKPAKPGDEPLFP